MQVLNGGLLFHAFSAYVLPLQQEFGWNRTLLASAFALIRMESGILGPLQGWMIDRFGPRRVMTVGNVLFAQVNSLTTFYAALAVVGLGSSLGGFMPIAATVTQWFARRRSPALGITLSGMGAGGMMVPLVVSLIASHGWRWMATLSAVLMHQIPHMVEGIGMSTTAAGSVVVVLVVVVMCGQLLGGWIGDRVNKRLIIFAAMWMHAVAMIIFAYTDSLLRRRPVCHPARCRLGGARHAHQFDSRRLFRQQFVCDDQRFQFSGHHDRYDVRAAVLRDCLRPDRFVSRGLRDPGGIGRRRLHRRAAGATPNSYPHN